MGTSVVLRETENSTHAKFGGGGGGGGGGNGANKVYCTCISGIFAKVASVLLILEELYLQDLKKLLC